MPRLNRDQRRAFNQPLLPAVVSPAALTGDVNNYDPGLGAAVSGVLRIDPGAAARSMTGLAGGAPGKVYFIFNISSTAGRTLTLVHASGSSSAANQFSGGNLADVVVRPGGAAMAWYDSASSLWRILAI